MRQRRSGIARRILDCQYLLLLLASPVLAADGDSCSPLVIEEIVEGSAIGPMTMVACRELIARDGSVTPVGPVSLNIWDLEPLPALPKYSLPSWAVFKLVTNDCTAGTITITNSEINGGFEHNFAEGSTISLASGANSMIRAHAPFGHVFNARGASIAGCVNGYTVYVMLYVEGKK